MMQAASNNTNNENLIWLDMEMSGLLPDSDRILELAAVVTDAELNVLGESPVLVIHQSDAVLNGMDAWNKGTHSRSGLIEKVKASTLSEQDATAEMISFLKSFVPAGKSPMCGNSICQDRRFMVRYMPDLEAYFHYRNLDVSVFKELARRWKPSIYSGFKKAIISVVASCSVSTEALTFSIKPLRLCVPLFQASMPSSTASL